MDDDRVRLVGSLYEALGRGDVGGAMALLQQTEWHEAEGMPYGGIYQGAHAIAENVFGPINADVEEFSARPDELLPAGDDRVLALGRYRGTGLDCGFAHVWTVREGMIVKFVQYADTHQFREAIARES
jgi:hypothetical protein